MNDSEGYRGLASSDAKEREEGAAEGAKTFRGVVAKQGHSNDGVCRQHAMHHNDISFLHRTCLLRPNQEGLLNRAVSLMVCYSSWCLLLTTAEQRKTFLSNEQKNPRRARARELQIAKVLHEDGGVGKREDQRIKMEGLGLTNTAGDEKDEEGVHDWQDGGGYCCEDVLEGAEPTKYANNLREGGCSEVKRMGLSIGRGCSLFRNHQHAFKASAHLHPSIHEPHRHTYQLHHHEQ